MHMDSITFIFIKSLFLTYAESYQVPHICCVSHYSTDFINFSINEPRLASNTTTNTSTILLAIKPSSLSKDHVQDFTYNCNPLATLMVAEIQNYHVNTGYGQ